MRFSGACILASLVLLPPGARAARPSADEAYAEARTGYYALKGDPARRKLRHHWLNVAKKFEQVASRYPKSPRAPEALFTSGELLAELSRFSAQQPDLDQAVADYGRLLEHYPTHRLADDAALALAKVAVDREDDVGRARKVLEQGLEKTPKGDRAKDMKALLATLPEPPKKAKVAAEKPVKGPGKEPARPGAEALNQAIAKASSKARSPSEGLSLAEIEALDGALEPEPALPRAPMPALERVQERLRAVRVGEPPQVARKADDKLARARLKLAAKNGRGAEMTLAEQLGLKVRRVVIDAGHGGHDSGAVGQKGTREKDVTLSVATKLAARLTEAGLEVVLTRDDDTFVRLEDRARHANEVHGDLFISVHCNSAPGHKLRGVETYTLNTSADRYSIRLAARENASSEKGISDLQFILADLATKANTEESSRLAVKVQSGLVGALKLKHKGVRDLGTKEALFYVLLGARMPAILVETSFLSHPEEEKLLATAAYQEDLAAAIAAGVQDFLGERQQRLAKID